MVELRDPRQVDGSNPSATLTINQNDLPPNLAPDADCGCGDSQLPGEADNSSSGSGGSFSDGGVRYTDGTVRVNTSDLGSSGFGTPWGQDRGWTNGPGYATASVNGTGMVTSQTPYLIQAGPDATPNDSFAVVTNGTTASYFDKSGSNYNSRFFVQNKFTSGTNEYTLTDTLGNQTKFYGFDTSIPVAQRGQFKSFTDPVGNVSTATYDGNGKLTEISRAQTVGGDTHTESYLYTYLTSGANSGLVSNVTLRRKINSGSWSTVRQVDYSYWENGNSHGNTGDLKKSVIKDGSGNTLDTTFYRYYTSDSASGYKDGLKFLFNTDSYNRLVQAGFNPETATDAQVDDYADLYLEYDSNHRTTKVVAQGEGCSTCSGGLGSYAYSYTSSANSPGYNSWATKTIETLPDGNQNIVYTNVYGQVMLKVFKEPASGQQWITFNKFDTSGRLILTAEPSAVSGYDDTKADLLDSQSSNYTHLRDSSGLIYTTTYSTSTTAGESTAGEVAGYVKETHLQRGETGTAIKQSAFQYFAHTGGGNTVNPSANQTVYRNTDGTGGQTTSYTYTWFASSTQMESVTVNLPIVSSGQNGPGTADVSIAFYDTYGRTRWTKDAEGHIGYFEYDVKTSALVKSIADVDTDITADFTGLPSGWSNSSGLHLKSTMVVDSLGRTVKQVSPGGTITWTVYKDIEREVRVYAGWDGTAGTTTGPIMVSRQILGGSFTESIAMSATPATTGSAPNKEPTGAELIGNVENLSRTYTSAGGQVDKTDSYYNVDGVFSDDFNRANSDSLGSSWTEQVGDSDISSNQLLGNDSVSLATYTTTTEADVSVQATVALSGSQTAGLVARYAGSGDQNMYVGQLVGSGGSFTAKISKNVSGTWTDLASAAVSGTITGTLRFEVQGSELRLFFNDAFLIAATDTAITAAGKVGVRTNSGVSADNFAVNNLLAYRTTYGYDKRGRQNRVDHPTGTITRTVYDSLGRVVSGLIGTDDSANGYNLVPIIGQRLRLGRHR